MRPILADRAGQRTLRRLMTFGGLSTGLYAYVAFGLPTSNRVEHVGLFLAIFALLFAAYLVAVSAVRAPGGGLRAGGVIFGFALVFRLLLVPAGLEEDHPRGAAGAFLEDISSERVAYEPFLLYDNDVWRYLWGGHVLAEGLNPYLHSPKEAGETESLSERLMATEPWRDVHGRVAFQSYRTVYPPVMHYVFGALARFAPASTAAVKLVLVALDMAMCVLVWHLLGACGLRRELTLVYAWNPAVLKEFAGSAHPDLLMMLPLMAAPYLLWRGWRAAGGAILAMSLAAKVASAVTVPLASLWAWRHAPERLSRGRLALAATLGAPVGLLAGILAAWWPLAGGLAEWWAALGVFAERWTFNSGVWQVVRWFAGLAGAERPENVAHVVCRVAIVVLVAAVALGFSRRRVGESRSESLTRLYTGFFLGLAVVILLSPAVMPWYVLWALPAAILAGSRSWPLLCGLSLLSYLSYADGVGTLWWKWLEYGAFSIAAVRDLGAKWRYPLERP